MYLNKQKLFFFKSIMLFHAMTTSTDCGCCAPRLQAFRNDEAIGRSVASTGVGGYSTMLHTHTHIHIYTHNHTHIHAQPYTYTLHAQPYTYTHTYTYTHAQPCYTRTYTYTRTSVQNERQDAGNATMQNGVNNGLRCLQIARRQLKGASDQNAFVSAFALHREAKGVTPWL